MKRGSTSQLAITTQQRTDVQFVPMAIEPHPNPVVEMAVQEALERMKPELDAYVEAIMQHGAVRLEFKAGKLITEPVRPGALFLP